MVDVLEAAKVTTPLAFLGLLVAFGYFAYAVRSRTSTQQLRLLPAEKRASAIDEYLTRYGIDGKKLPDDAKLTLIRDEMDKRHRRALTYVVIAAAVLVLCFSIAAAAWVYQSTEKKGEGAAIKNGELPDSKAKIALPPVKVSQLSLRLHGMSLLEESAPLLGKDGAAQFNGEDAVKVVDEASSWVSATLDRCFPRAEQDLILMPTLSFDKPSMSYMFQLEEDPLRRDFFWLITEDGMKKAHMSLKNARSALEDAINRAHAPGASERLQHLIVHCDRPGYELELIQVPSYETKPMPRTMKWLGKPFTVLVKLSGDGPVDKANMLRDGLDLQGVRVDRKSHDERKQRYEQAFDPKLSDKARYSYLQELRVDALVVGTYKELDER